jgi:hypothetical protein
MDGPSLAFKFKLQLQVEPGRVPFRRGCFLTVTVKMLPTGSNRPPFKGGRVPFG